MSAYSFIIQNGPEYKSIAHNLKMGRFPFGLLGLPPATKNLLIHTLCENTSHGALVVLPDEASAIKCRDDLSAFGTEAVFYPARDFNFHSAESSSKEYEQLRIFALSKAIENEKTVLVCSAEALVQRTVPPEILKNKIFTLTRGQEISTEKLRQKLVGAGYSYSDMVEGAGQFALRGGILDIFPTNSEQPLRIEFWGDEIDSISYFDVISQRRTDEISRISLTPCTEVLFNSNEDFISKLEELAKTLRGKNAVKAKENINKDIELLKTDLNIGTADKYLPLAYEKRATVLDYFENSLLLINESFGVRDKITAAEKLLNEEIKEMFADGVLCRGLDNYTLEFSKIAGIYEKRKTVYIDNFARGSFDTPTKDLITFSINQTSRWDGSYKILIEDLSPAIRNKYTIIVFAGTEKGAEGLLEEFTEDGISALICKAKPGLFQPGYVNIVPGTISAGIDYPAGKTVIVTYGRDVRSAKRRASVRKKKDPNAFNSLEELHKGDYVVHSTSGIGIFDGIEQVQMEGVTKDYIKIRYAKGDILYVPVTKLELVTKYIGPHEEDGARTVKINRLGSGEWEKTKSRVRTQVKDIAENLIKIYAERQASDGYAFSPDIDMQNDFERRFEFDETDDQLRCVDEIKTDMEKRCPMDRLLCGDVGFGKTEVALRAAFKCICDGKQAAILVPTTILALQHYRTVLHRMEGFPVEVDMLSRFRTPKQQKDTLNRLKSGAVDILVGTHRIISKDVQFKDLGLLIIDEEQRFGVAQKEKLKEKFPGVDVLTLSATPIPRTLNFAMMGIRDLSVIEEAPLDRYPIQTYVMEHDPLLIEQAISKEIRRGGQVYYLHNRIDDISDTAGLIKEMFPDVNIGIAHGRMNEEELSNVWRQLLEGEIQVLVCTTIIETGVDVPNVNTLIIEDADKMGLAQLHQIRGRVGRSSRRAYAYCTFKQGKEISEIAEKRLTTIREFTQFGSGFKIAMRDLEIRGAGNMLGAQQSGHIEAVGYDLYIELLSQAVAALKQGDETFVPKKDCLVDIHIDAHIPESYIESYPQRIAIYKRIADIHSEEDAMDVTDELIDRYGEPPASAMGLIKVALLKNTAADNGIHEITQRGNNLILFTSAIDKEVLKKLSVLRSRVTANASNRPYYSVRVLSGQNSLGALEDCIKALAAKEEEKNVSS
ncbi:MAG: transcription-repair coupling factor [Oscillospiraceae bacterium]|nr:transcription-repair coupling factor [Oscillospiraceae bacterium]